MTTASNLFQDFLPAFRSDKTAKPDSRSYEIDGLRGWASFSVVVYHMFWELFGVLVPSMKNPVTGFFLNGPLSVSVFFVLSGDALSSAYFAGKGELSVVKLVLKRYSRLAIPISAICLVVFLLCHFNLAQNIAAGRLVDRPDWIGSWLHFPISFGYLLKYSFVNVFVVDTPTIAINPFLWTMKTELIGSIVTFAILIFFPYFRKPWTLVGAMAVLAIFVPHAGQFSCFLFGIIFCAARTHGTFFRLRANRLVNAGSWIGLVVLALGVGFLHWKGWNERAPAFAVAMTFLIFCNQSLSTFFQNRFSLFLGKLSFPMYLTQFPVLISLTSSLIVLAAARGQLSLGTEMAIASFSVAATVIAAVLFDPVEIGTKWFGNTMVNVLIMNAPPTAMVESRSGDSAARPQTVSQGPIPA